MAAKKKTQQIKETLRVCAGHIAKHVCDELGIKLDAGSLEDLVDELEESGYLGTIEGNMATVIGLLVDDGDEDEEDGDDPDSDDPDSDDPSEPDEEEGGNYEAVEAEEAALDKLDKRRVPIISEKDIKEATVITIEPTRRR